MKYRLVSGKPSIGRPVRYGFAMFAIGMATGIVATYYTAGVLVADMPGGDHIEAMWRDVRLSEYTLIGWGLTFLVSSALGVAVGLRSYDPEASKRAEQLEQAQSDKS